MRTLSICCIWAHSVLSCRTVQFCATFRQIYTYETELRRFSPVFHVPVKIAEWRKRYRMYSMSTWTLGKCATFLKGCSLEEHFDQLWKKMRFIIIWIRVSVEIRSEFVYALFFARCRFDLTVNLLGFKRFVIVSLNLETTHGISIWVIPASLINHSRKP